MEAILVISDEPALAEALADEFGEEAVTALNPAQSATHVPATAFRLIVTDSAAISGPESLPAAFAEAPLLAVSRPIRLADLLYTIRRHLQNKTASARKDMTLAPGYRFLASERILLTPDGDARIAVTEKEAELLCYLFENRDETVSREQLLREVWNYSEDAATHTLETHLSRLRGKLKQASDTFDIVFAEQDGGWRLKLS